MSEKTVQNVSVSQCYQLSRKFDTQYQGDNFAPFSRNMLLFQRGNCSIYRCSVKLDKVDFLKLQNGSDIRGVAIAGVEGEPISLTEPVSEAIQLLLLHASHLPYNRNGFKILTNSGGLGKPDIKNILERAADIYDKFTAVRKAAGNIEKPLEGFHIVVDKGNGAGGFFAAKVLEPLGAVTTGSQFLEPDGMFPNHIPNPEDKTAMKAITQAVLDNKADLGIIFDADVNRSAAVDSTGLEFNQNRLIACMSAIVLEGCHFRISDGLTTFIEKKLGGKHHRFKRSYKNVIDEAIRLNSIGEESHLAIETSDHGALKENHCLDDGAYLMVKILNKLASACASGQSGGSKVLTGLLEGLEIFRGYGEAVLKHLENYVDSDPKLRKAPLNYEGVGVSGNRGWFLLRLSLHDHVLPLNIEAPSNSGAMLLGNVVLAAVKEFPALDTSALDKFVQAS
ncbi:hypothetical protein C1H46_039722 [Malus baccata]|uniref:Alpha-D-phosphohexomutase alpha/beta/alpha domain-containing protein n=1 Tax=Malus baccata TaxID=106549 RepID=A0A540KKQ4_MALBA|nr:hypothetical protein C1H46_039722 [Malus baccata]